MPQSNSQIPAWIIPVCLLFYIVINILSWNFPFFWDSLLTSAVSTWFLENGFNNGILPSELDAGHPPLFYAWLTAWWSFFGRSLLISHLAMLPILVFMVWNFCKLSIELLKDTRLAAAAILLFCLETTIIAQSTMVSYDILMLALYLAGLRYVIRGRSAAVGIISAIMLLTSLRGIPAVISLIITEFLLFRKSRPLTKITAKYIPGILLLATWLSWHKFNTGWAFATPDPKWASQRGFAGAAGMAGNLLAMIRVMTEPGRLVLSLALLAGLLGLIRGKAEEISKQVWPLFLIPAVVLAAFTIPFTNPVGHRYFMILYAMAILVAVSHYGLFRRFVWAAILVAVSGHFWIYPGNFSNGWDSSLAHLFYFKARERTWHFMDHHKIPAEDVKSLFPLNVSRDQEILDGDKARIKELRNTNETGIIMWSNVSNDFNEIQKERFTNDCELIHLEHFGPVRIALIVCD